MTREEAIKVLKNPPRVYDEDMWTALDMAIEALSAQEGGDAEVNEIKPKYMQSSPDRGDLISRADAIDAVIYNEPYDIFHTIEDIRALPSADRKGHWIDNDRSGTFKIWQCSECAINMEARWNFCPHCGADMRVGEQSE